MRKQIVNIAGRDFVLQGTMDFDTTKASQRDLWDCYERPSDAKRHIWGSWSAFFNNKVDCEQYGIYSYNCMTFTINAIAYVHELDCYCYFYITKKRQEIWKLI